MKAVKHLCIVLLLGLICHSAHSQSVVDGKIDLSKHDFNTGGLVLSGNWEFYWDRLLLPSDLTNTQNSEWMAVPGSWDRSGNHPVLGCATYRITIKVAEDQSGLSLYFPIINSSAKIWVNDNLVKETSIVSKAKNEYKPRLIGTLIPLPEKISPLQIVVQVANYTYFNGGIASPPQIDKSSSIFERMNRVYGIENFFAGSLIALFIYQLILYLLFNRGKPNLWLALICLGVALRALIIHGGSFLLPNLFPYVPWEFWKKIEFGSVYAIIALFPLYVFHLFTDHAPKKPIWVFVSVASILCLIVILTPQYYYGKLLDVSHVMLLLAFVYAIYSISKAWRAGSEDARIILFGVLASFPFILLEILKNSRILILNLEIKYLVELGVLVFLLFQVYLLASHYAKSYQNLEVLNQNLEKIVQERTGELMTANIVKDRLLSVVSHDIKSPLNSLQGILHLYNIGTLSPDEFGSLTKKIESELGKTSMLVDNILFWTASQLKGVRINLEKFNVTSLIQENINLFQNIALSKEIFIKHIEPTELIIHSDRNIINLVLRNLLANAIKFSFEGGGIEIHTKLVNTLLSIEIKDHGTGMSIETIQTLMKPQTTVSTSGTTHEKGTGLGLALCRDYLKQIGGVLTIESLKGKGSSFIIELPI